MRGAEDEHLGREISETVRITELIAALRPILDAHGDLTVMHHDDWTEFLVERVEFRPGRGSEQASSADDDSPFGGPENEAGVYGDDRTGWTEPPHVLVSGHTYMFDGNGGLARDDRRQPRPTVRPSGSYSPH